MIGTHRAARSGKSRAGDGAAQVVVRAAVVTGKVWAGEPKNPLDLSRRPTLPEQVSGDPPIDDAPVGLREPFADVPALHQTLIDLGASEAVIPAASCKLEWALEAKAGRGGDAKARADCSRASARGAKPAWVSTTFTQGA